MSSEHKIFVNEKTFRIACEPWHFDYGIWLRVRHGRADEPESVSYATNLHLTASKGEELTPPEPLFRLRKDEMQQLMDELWRVGLRPSEGSGSAGALAATERHLEDMRTIAMQTLAALPPKIPFETQYRPNPAI